MIEGIYDPILVNTLFDRKKRLIIISITTGCILILLKFTMGKQVFDGLFLMYFVLAFVAIVFFLTFFVLRQLKKQENEMIKTKYLLTDNELIKIDSIGNKQIVNLESGTFTNTNKGIHASNQEVFFILPSHISNFDEFLSELSLT
jgi:hypothetical protein